MTPIRGRRRQLGPLQKMMAAAGAAGLVIAALIGGRALVDLRPDANDRYAPFLIAGGANENVNVRTFDVTLLGARYVSAVKANGLNRDTTGVWMVLKVRFVVHREAQSIGYAAIATAAGRTYLASDRFRQPLVDGSRRLQPGIPVEGEIAFELPRDAVAGATARFAAKPFDVRMDAVADIAVPGTETVDVGRTPATLAPVVVVTP